MDQFEAKLKKESMLMKLRDQTISDLKNTKDGASTIVESE